MGKVLSNVGVINSVEYLGQFNNRVAHWHGVVDDFLHPLSDVSVSGRVSSDVELAALVGEHLTVGYLLLVLVPVHRSITEKHSKSELGSGQYVNVKRV